MHQFILKHVLHFNTSPIDPFTPASSTCLGTVSYRPGDLQRKQVLKYEAISQARVLLKTSATVSAKPWL